VSLLKVNNLVKHYTRRKSLSNKSRLAVHAVDGVSLTIDKGEVLGLVGESGCGKSTLGRLIARLEEKTSGEIYFHGKEISSTRGKSLRLLRRNFQIIFQDTSSSLNPRWKTRPIIEEPMLNFEMDESHRHNKCIELLDLVGLDKSDAEKYPHELSGGQRQRVNIARALALEPALLICDEPVSSLDVSIRAQVLKLLQSLQQKLQLSYLFISHDLAAVSTIATRVAVMYLGQIVEVLPAAGLEKTAAHPYTRALIEAVPMPDPHRAAALLRPAVRGEPPDPSNPPPGCRFHPRCPLAEEKCRIKKPAYKKIEEQHYAACHLL